MGKGIVSLKIIEYLNNTADGQFKDVRTIAKGTGCHYESVRLNLFKLEGLGIVDGKAIGNPWNCSWRRGYRIK